MWIKLPREQKQDIVEAVQRYFETERDESIGSVAAEGIVDFFVEALARICITKASTTRAASSRSGSRRSRTSCTRWSGRTRD